MAVAAPPDPAAIPAASPVDDGRDARPAECDLPRERRARWTRAATLGVLLALVVAGATGALGIRARTTVVRSADGTEVRVTHPAVARAGVAVPMEIEVRRTGGFTGPIEVAMTTSYLRSFDENGMGPEPASSSTTGEVTRWTFDPPDGESLVVWFDHRAEPGVQWRRSGTVTVTYDGVATGTDVSTWFLP